MKTRSIARTVLGDIEPEEMGVCYAHEHIIIDPSFTTFVEADFQIDSVDKAVEELHDYKSNGGRMLVDSLPCDCGRNVLKLAAVSKQSGVHIICPTGLHLDKYYPPGHWGNSYDSEQLTELFISDIETGIDLNDYSGPLVERTQHRAGLIKIATGGERFSSREYKVFEAAAAAHRRTGCPILTHTEQGVGALEQVKVLQEFGVNISKVTLSHTDRKPDVEYHRDILSSGVKLEYDSAFRWKKREVNHTLNLLCSLFNEFPNQLMLGMDAARSSYWRSYGGSPGMSYLLTTFVSMLKSEGFGCDAIHKVFVSNPASSYAFIPQKTNDE